MPLKEAIEGMIPDALKDKDGELILAISADKTQIVSIKSEGGSRTLSLNIKVKPGDNKGISALRVFVKGKNCKISIMRVGRGLGYYRSTHYLTETDGNKIESDGAMGYRPEDSYTLIDRGAFPEDQAGQLPQKIDAPSTAENLIAKFGELVQSPNGFTQVDIQTTLDAYIQA